MRALRNAIPTMIGAAIGAILMLAWVAVCHAAWIQYDTTTGEVLGTFDVQADTRPMDGTALLSVQGNAPASAIVWPVPDTCEAGRLDWTRVSASRALVVDPALTFYRCQVVGNWPELKAARDRLIWAIDDSYEDLPAVEPFNRRTNQACPATENAPKCKSVKAKNSKHKVKAPTIDRLDADLTERNALADDAIDIKTRKGW
jgi:hypothetical protein